jgi:lipopolysaccharide transport system permease protein
MLKRAPEADRETVLVLEAGRASAHYWKDLWAYRELFAILAWRDISVRYKQTIIGIAWALIRPLLTVVVFTVIFGHVAKLPSEGDVPYSLMVFSGMLPWFLMSSILSDGSNSLVNNATLVGKVYFPRLIIPASSAVVAVVDFLINLAMLLLLMLIFGFLPSWRFLTLPAFVALAIAVSAGPALLFTSLNVEYRDFRYIIPFLLQFGMYVTPVGFSSSVIPDAWRFLFSLNPAVMVIDGFRWAILGSDFYWPGLLAGCLTSVPLLWAGLSLFRRLESTFADAI